MYKHLKQFDAFSQEAGVVSFDFDGVLHRSIYPGTYTPLNFDDPDSWEPFYEVFDVMKKEALLHRIVVITKRDEYMREELEYFVKKYDLPVDEIICTNNGRKLPYLLQIPNIRKHYDDHYELIKELRGTGIGFVRVNPFTKQFMAYRNPIKSTL